jgi:hypothetical protein
MHFTANMKEDEPIRHETNNYTENYIGAVKKDHQRNSRGTAGDFIRAQYVTIAGLIREVKMKRPESMLSKKTKEQLEEKWKRSKQKGKGRYFTRHEISVESTHSEDDSGRESKTKQKRHYNIKRESKQMSDSSRTSSADSESTATLTCWILLHLRD